MSDLATLKSMLDRAEVTYSDADIDSRIVEATDAIEIKAGSGKGNSGVMGRPLGYQNSFAKLHFDADGNLVAWSNWE